MTKRDTATQITLVEQAAKLDDAWAEITKGYVRRDFKSSAQAKRRMAREMRVELNRR